MFAHIIPYWEGMPKEKRVEGSLALYDRLRAAYPDKKIVIGEFGWPSAGHNFEAAVPNPVSQAVLLRNFVRQANVRDIDYNIVEAIDQPQKLFEGNVGPYWGMLERRCGRNLPGPGRWSTPTTGRRRLLAVRSACCLSLSILVLRERPSARQRCSPPRII